MKLRLAENFRAVFYAPFYAAQTLGCFAREGVEIEFIASSTPGDAVAGLLDGTIDLTWGGPMRVMKARDHRRYSPLICFCEVVSRDPFYLIGRPGIEDFRFSELACLRFATVSEVPTPWMCLQHDLILAGIDPGELARVTDRTMAENFEALRDGRLDAAQLFEPFVTLALRGGFGKILYAASARGPCVYTSFIASRDRLARDVPAFAAMTRAVAQMQEWLKVCNGEELAAVVESFFPNIAHEVLAEALERYRSAGIWSQSPDMSREGFARLADSLLCGGFLSQSPSYKDCMEGTVD